MDWQTWPGDDCLAGGIVAALRAVRTPALPLGRLNVNVVDGTRRVALHLPRAKRVALQVAVRNACAYGHYALVLVDAGLAYLFDPDGRPGDFRDVFAHLRARGIAYGGSLATYLGIDAPRHHNRGRDDCALWVAFVYHLLATRAAAAVLALPLRVQRRLLAEFTDVYLSK